MFINIGIVVVAGVHTTYAGSRPAFALSSGRTSFQQLHFRHRDWLHFLGSGLCPFANFVSDRRPIQQAVAPGAKILHGKQQGGNIGTSFPKARDAPAMCAIDSRLDPVQTHNSLVRRLARVLRRPALGTDEKEMSPTLPIIELDVVNVAVVEQLECSQLLVRADAFTVKALVLTEQKVLLDGLHLHMGHLLKSWNRPTSSDPRKGR